MKTVTVQGESATLSLFYLTNIVCLNLATMPPQVWAVSWIWYDKTVENIKWYLSDKIKTL